MLITNLTATENNGVVTAEFIWDGSKIKIELELDPLIKHSYGFVCAVKQLYEKQKLTVLDKLEIVLSDFINHNLQEAE